MQQAADITKMRRFQGEPPPSTCIKDIERAEIERQTKAFLDSGGEIEVLETAVGEGVPQHFVSTHVPTLEQNGLNFRPSREFVDGRWLVRVPAVAKILGLTEQGARIKSRRADFPRAIKGSRPQTWEESAILKYRDSLK